MKVSDKATLTIACISIVLYSSLALTCAYNAFKFWEVLKGRLEAGYYAHAKFVFFVVLGASAVLELPTFLGCVVEGGPYGCVWDEDDIHNLVWCSHMWATCGFMYSVISTSTLWSDVIQQKDGNFFLSASPLDNTKIYFRVAFIVYCVVVLVSMAAVMIKEKSSHNDQAYAHSHEIGAVSYCIVPVMLVLITFGCFYSGLRLEQHVMKAQLPSNNLTKIFLNLNITMFVICSSYILRAILILSLYSCIPAAYANAMSSTWHYVIWIPLTQWFPYVVCSFCLVEQMRFRPVEKRPESIIHAQVELGDAQGRTMSKDSVLSDTSIGPRMTIASSTDGAWKTFAGTEEGDARPSVNYFDAQSNWRGEMSPPVHDAAAMDHFFTTNALHLQSSSRQASVSVAAGNSP